MDLHAAIMQSIRKTEKAALRTHVQIYVHTDTHEFIGPFRLFSNPLYLNGRNFRAAASGGRRTYFDKFESQHASGAGSTPAGSINSQKLHY